MSDEVIKHLQNQIQNLFIEKRALEQTLQDNQNINLNLRKYNLLLEQRIQELEIKLAQQPDEKKSKELKRKKSA